MLTSCPFYNITGFYCPGCGGTRAFFALLSGEVIKSFLLHPFVLYVFVMLAAFAVAHLLSLISHGKIRRLKARPIYLWIALGIVIVNFLVKNILLLCGIPVLELL